MRIISKLTDYYDFAVGYQNDKSLILNRNVEISGDYKLENTIVSDRLFNLLSHDVMFNASSLLFCGIRYPVVTTLVCVDRIFSESTIVVSEGMLSDRVPHSDKETYHTLLFPKYGGKYPLYWRYRDEWVDVLKSYKVPYLRGSVLSLPDGKSHRKTLFRPLKSLPILKDIGFSKILSAAQAYQYIENFILQELNSPNMLELTNSDRVLKAGFDPKQSFRHRQN